MILRVVKKLRGIKIMEKYWSRFQDTYDEKQEYVVGKEILTSIKEELNFSPDKLALLIEKAGFQVEKSKLIGDRTKALYLIGKKK